MLCVGSYTVTPRPPVHGYAAGREAGEAFFFHTRIQYHTQRSGLNGTVQWRCGVAGRGGTPPIY